MTKEQAAGVGGTGWAPVATALAGLYPSLVALLFASTSGTLPGGARAVPAALGWLSVAPLALAGARRWHDPLDLGRLAVLPWAAWLWTVFAWWTSPVPRAGSVGVVSAPFWLLAVPGVARCWRTEDGRRWGRGLLLVGAGGVALFSMVDWLASQAERPALPLGHHNLLALWLLGCLGVAVIETARRGSPRRRLVLDLVVAAILLVGLLATRSVAGFAGLLALGAWVWMGGRRIPELRSDETGSAMTERGRPRSRVGSSRRRAAWLLVGAVIAATVFFAPRLSRIVAGKDPSTAARIRYLEAAIHGTLSRPLQGWGPGSSSWLLARFVEPAPGILPPAEIVTDPHSVLLDIGFETGVPGVLLVVAVLLAWLRRRSAEGSIEAEPSVGALLAISVASLGAGWFDCTALPILAMVLAGGALPPADVAAGTRGGNAQRWTVVVCALWISVSLWWLAPRARAQWRYQTALRLEGSERRHELERAVASDPEQPLYRLQLAIAGGAAAAAQAERAAQQAEGLSAFWLVAGRLGEVGHRASAALAFERACDLDPLSAAAPYSLAALTPQDPLASERLARALIAEPRLLAAPLPGRQPELLRAAVQRIEAASGLPVGWRSALVEAWRAGLDGVEVSAPDQPSARARLELAFDADDESSLSLYAFRRERSRQVVWSVALDRGRLALVDGLVPASRLEQTAPRIFAPGCRLGD